MNFKIMPLTKNLADKSKDGKNQNTALLASVEKRCINGIFNAKRVEEGLSAIVSYDTFAAEMQDLSDTSHSVFSQSRALEVEFKKQLAGLWYG